MKKLNFLWLAIIGSVVLFSACDDSNPNPDVEQPKGGLENGVLIVNEGAITGFNASVSFYDADSLEMFQKVFQSANPALGQLGDVLQSVAFANYKVYLVLNNSKKVLVFDASNLEYIGEVEGNFSYPNHAVTVNENKLYVSNGDGFSNNKIYVIDTQTDQCVDSVNVGTGPAYMTEKDGKVYVAMQGGWSFGNHVYVINSSNNSVEKVLKVGDIPTDFAFDVNGNLWVMCKGRTIYDGEWNAIGAVNATLYKMDVNTQELVDSLNFDAPLQGFGYNCLDIDKSGTKLLYENGGLFQVAIDATTLPTTPLIANTFWYGFNVDPETGNIWGLISSFSGNGQAVVYDMDGNNINTYSAGVGPNAVIFR